jgi:exosortase A-associated hydrolase 2
MTLGVCCDESVRPAPQPFFLEGGLGPLFCLLFAPAPNMLPRGTILYLPPFAEEANRSRRMAVLQAGRLAARGWAVLLLDPFGTGDSAGEFREARWDQWLADAGRAANWLAACWPDRPITLWGLRLGALLAADLAARETNRFSRLLFWQPLLRGDRFITQFLRLRTAAAMTVGEKESSEDLRARLADDEILEVAGYELAPDLVRRHGDRVARTGLVRERASPVTGQPAPAGYISRWRRPPADLQGGHGRCFLGHSGNNPRAPAS